MAALELTSHDMQRYIRKNIEAHIFKDGKIHSIELQYKDIRLDLNIKNNTCGIIAFSRGHYVREHLKHRIMHRPALQHEPASSKGEGAIFLALVVLHCNTIVPINWITRAVTEWWNLKGVCSIKDACTITTDGVTINNKKFIIWSQKILMLPVDIELEDIKPVDIAPNDTPTIQFGKEILAKDCHLYPRTYCWRTKNENHLLGHLIYSTPTKTLFSREVYLNHHDNDVIIYVVCQHELEPITGKFMTLQDSIASDRELEEESRGGKSKRKKSKQKRKNRKTRKY